MSEQKIPMFCAHKETEIWEPHLAGARKCKSCSMVYNPNREPHWQHEIPEKDWKWEYENLRKFATQFEEERDKYREALEFYADEETWDSLKDSPPPVIWDDTTSEYVDLSKRARQALGNRYI